MKSRPWRVTAVSAFTSPSGIAGLARNLSTPQSRKAARSRRAESPNMIRRVQRSDRSERRSLVANWNAVDIAKVEIDDRNVGTTTVAFRQAIHCVDCVVHRKDARRSQEALEDNASPIATIHNQDF